MPIFCCQYIACYVTCAWHIACLFHIYAKRHLIKKMKWTWKMPRRGVHAWNIIYRMVLKKCSCLNKCGLPGLPDNPHPWFDVIDNRNEWKSVENTWKWLKNFYDVHLGSGLSGGSVNAQGAFIQHYTVCPFIWQIKYGMYTEYLRHAPYGLVSGLPHVLSAAARADMV